MIVWSDMVVWKHHWGAPLTEVILNGLKSVKLEIPQGMDKPAQLIHSVKQNASVCPELVLCFPLSLFIC